MRKFIAAALASTIAMAAPANAATLLVDGSGQLTGATGVDVGGVLYDVTFLDGSCVGIFGTCTTESFTFTTQAAADEAAQSLLDTVFVDNALGAFDTAPNLIRGCENSSVCRTVIPVTEVGALATASLGTIVENTNSVNGDFLSFGNFNQTLDYTGFSSLNYATFSLSTGTVTGAVPEPGTWALMLLGFGGIGMAIRRRREQKPRVRYSFS